MNEKEFERIVENLANRLPAPIVLFLSLIFSGICLIISYCFFHKNKKLGGYIFISLGLGAAFTAITRFLLNI